jgi:phage-related tail fiber protein
MSYGILTTDIGNALLAAAESNGSAIILASLAIGDGKGASVTPTGAETALVRQVFQTAFESKNVNRSDASIVDLVVSIPPTEGGWMMREVGVFTSDGKLFAYGNTAERYQPTASEGETGESTLTVRLKVGRASLVTITVDSAKTSVSQQYVQNYVDGLLTNRLDAAARKNRLNLYFVGQS